MFKLVVERGECLVFLLIYKFLNGVFFMTANALTLSAQIWWGGITVKNLVLISSHNFS